MRKKLIKWWGNFVPMLRLSKRQQFVAVTLVLTLELGATQLLSHTLEVGILFVLGVSAYVLSALVLREELSGWEFITLLVLPSFYTMAVFLFYFLLPERWLTRLPFAVLYAIGMYAILLTENIYNVAAERNIRLLRAAHSVGFLLTLLTFFFLVDTVLSLHFPFYLNGILIGLITFPLSLQALWSMELSSSISKRVWVGSLVITLMLIELALVFSFWPIRITIEALFLTTVFYTLIGMTQQFLIDRLFPKTTREFIIVSVIVFILVLFTTRWGSGLQ